MSALKERGSRLLYASVQPRQSLVRVLLSRLGKSRMPSVCWGEPAGCVKVAIGVRPKDTTHRK